MRRFRFPVRIAVVLSALTAAVAAAMAAPSPAQAAPSTFAAGSTVHGIGIQTVGVQCDDGTRIRNAPISGTILGLCYSVHAVTAICYRSIAGQAYLWLYLTDNSTGVTGWSYGQYLHPTGSGSLYAC
ncbi:hypothetical protein [Hamadaea tsunoensis]|uniref:hypothetical protein n=1 Tax=Hamadaea tsunoensis TaxID=53368 RepID=UPI00041CA106|nr:hypothetical protein [Hamadaea tsunoensis]